MQVPRGGAVVGSLRKGRAHGKVDSDHVRAGRPES